MSITPLDQASAAVGMKPTEETPPSTTDRNADLREVAKQLEEVFLQQLFQAMRAAAPEGTTATARTSNDFFGSMMDEHLAEAATSRITDSLGEALYRQLAGASPTQPTATPAVDAGEAKK